LTADVEAAGGIILRCGAILLVHRPAYDDWSLPKGKLHPGESWEQCARREVEEETGLDCEPGEEAGRCYYTDGRGRSKEVRYFLMDPDREPVPQNEIDEVRWVLLEEAPAILTYDHDRELVTQVTSGIGS
jgi:8-oxo-dGTP diphosphatase